jgi:hypothetical protein
VEPSLKAGLLSHDEFLINKAMLTDVRDVT